MQCHDITIINVITVISLYTSNTFYCYYICYVNKAINTYTYNSINNNKWHVMELFSVKKLQKTIEINWC